MEEQLFSKKTQIERKLFYFDLKQNPRGRFLKVTEDVRGRRDTIIIPSTGLQEIKDILEEVLAAEAELGPFKEEAALEEEDYEYDDDDAEEEDEDEDDSQFNR